jgi:hypothetical protein
MSAYGGVSTHLLDHILITILLLVTDVYEWVTATNVIDDPLQPASLDPPTSDSNWRNMMYSEPVYPSAQSAMTVEDSPPNSPKDPTSSGQWADILYSDSMYPSQRRPSPSISGFSQASRATWDTSRPPGGSSLHLTPADSVSLQTPTESTYYDPAAPPVPEIPLQYRSSPSMSSVSIARSPLNPHTREVPSPLSSLDIERPRFDQSWPRPQSTPPEPPPSVHRPSPMSHSRQTSGIGRINSMFKSTTARQLPKPPQNQAPVPSVASLQEKRASHFPSRSLPPTPSGPSSSVPVVNAQLAQRQEHLEKEVHELVDWVQTLTSERHMPSARDVVFDVPPPAYNDINFSRSSDRPALH